MKMEKAPFCYWKAAVQKSFFQPTTRNMFCAVGCGGGEDGVWSPFWLSTYCATCKLTFPLRVKGGANE